MESQENLNQIPVDKVDAKIQSSETTEEPNNVPSTPKSEIMGQSATLSPSRVMKLQDPERLSRDRLSNTLIGSHLDDVLEENINNYTSTRKQLIILTSAGKPVYSYGRDEEDLAHVTGIIQALDSNFISMGERLKYIETEKGYFVLETIGPLIFFCYSPKEGCTIQIIQELFRLLYQQIVMLLSKAAINRLEKQPNYDIRELLGNSASHLTNVINQCEISLNQLYQCYSPLMIQAPLRAQLRDLLLRMKRPDTVYAGLGINNSVILSLQNKQFPLSPINQTLLQTLITKSVAFRSSEGWIPICITDVKDDAYLHLYVGFMTEDMYVYFITTANSPDVFDSYSEIKSQIYNALLQSDRIIELYAAYNKALSVNEPCVPDLIHFLFKNDICQVIMPKIDERIYDYHDYYTLIKQYQLAYSHMIQNNLNDYFENTSEWCILASKQGTSIFIVVCRPFLKIDDILDRKQKLGEWLLKRKNYMIQKEHIFF